MQRAFTGVLILTPDRDWHHTLAAKRLMIEGMHAGWLGTPAS